MRWSRNSMRSGGPERTDLASMRWRPRNERCAASRGDQGASVAGHLRAVAAAGRARRQGRYRSRAADADRRSCRTSRRKSYRAAASPSSSTCRPTTRRSSRSGRTTVSPMCRLMRRHGHWWRRGGGRCPRLCGPAGHRAHAGWRIERRARRSGQARRPDASGRRYGRHPVTARRHAAARRSVCAVPGMAGDAGPQRSSRAQPSRSA